MDPEEALLADDQVAAAFLLGQEEAGLAERLPRLFPWTRHLPEGAVARMAHEMAAQGTREDLSATITGWRHTAEIHADPELYEALKGPLLCEGPIVPYPELTDGV